jgi:hypothetical protein
VPYAVISRRTKRIAIRSLLGALAIYRTRESAEADCLAHQRVAEVSVKPVNGRLTASDDSPTSPISTG